MQLPTLLGLFSHFGEPIVSQTSWAPEQHRLGGYVTDAKFVSNQSWHLVCELRRQRDHRALNGIANIDHWRSRARNRGRFDVFSYSAYRFASCPSATSCSACNRARQLLSADARKRLIPVTSFGTIGGEHRRGIEGGCHAEIIACD